jgi:hypothetical protein
MPGLVLHLGQQDRLALERRRPRDPIAFGQLTDDLRVRVLADLADQRPAIALRHPVLRLHADALVDALLETTLLLVELGRRQMGAGIHHLCIHEPLSCA